MNRHNSMRKPRASSQARIEHILSAARALLREQGVASLTIYAVAQRAQMPPSSVYHFFASVPALLQALTADVHAAFRQTLSQPIEHATLRTWHDLARIIETRMLQIYANDSAARQLLLVQHGLSEIIQADQQHDHELGQLLRELFEQHFELSPLPIDIDIFALAMSLGDRVYALSIQLHERITERFAEEAVRVVESYLGAYLPSALPKRSVPLKV